jgi:hypothetical protein
MVLRSPSAACWTAALSLLSPTSARLVTAAARALSSAAAGSQHQSPPSNLQQAMSASAEASGLTPSAFSSDLLEKLQDKALLHSAGLIGGKWLGAWNNATYEVRASLHSAEREEGGSVP